MRCVKLNIDGARDKDDIDDIYGCGGIIRGNEEERFGGFSKSIGLVQCLYCGVCGACLRVFNL